MFRHLFFALSALLICSGCAHGERSQSPADSLNVTSDSITPSSGKVSLLFVGDAMQHAAQLDRAKELGGDGKTYDYSDCFDLITPIISEADYSVVNLEVPLGGGPRYSGYPCFSAPDSYAVALKDAGFDLFLTANNHCLDSGDKAAKRTLTALDSIGVDHIGTYRNRSERDSLTPLIKDINGIKFAFLNYTYGTNGIEPKEDTEVSGFDRELMAAEIRRAREKGAEMVIVCIHWGVEYVLVENSHQRDMAEFLKNQGVDLIIGSHPHVIQPMKIERNEKENKDILVVYSLGNFISNMKTADTRGGALVRVNIERDSVGKPRLAKAEYDTFFAAKPEGNHNFRVYPSNLEESIPSPQRHHWQIFNTSARRIFDTHNVNVPAIK